MNRSNTPGSVPGNGKTVAVIVAAGRGERIAHDGNGPKQYRKIGQHSILWHTMRAFATHELIDHVQVVIHEDDRMLYDESCYLHDKVLPPVTGGATRQLSCAAGVLAFGESKPFKVLIHDAARPFVHAETIATVVGAIEAGTGVLPVHPIVETVKLVRDGKVVETLDRNELFCAQTPQGFCWQDIASAHEKAMANGFDHFTDDAAVGEWASISIKTIEVSPDNMKITTSRDLAKASQRMEQEESQLKQGQENHMIDVRTGSGYDVHQTCAGDHVFLCGVRIDHDCGLSGHSDADVGLHSLTDALLGTIGEGDIGKHFPPSDPKWKGAASPQFLEHAVKLVRQNGGTITNLDVTIVCEGPKIGPHRDKMRQAIADIANLELKRVSVKATTNEKIGFIGRNEGIAALATATVSF